MPLRAIESGPNEDQRPTGSGLMLVPPAPDTAAQTMSDRPGAQGRPRTDIELPSSQELVPDKPKVKLNARDELEFRKWYAAIASQMGLDPDPDAPEHFYDYRAAWLAGDKPDEKTQHWSSAHKRLGHPNLIVGDTDTRTGKRVPLEVARKYQAEHPMEEPEPQAPEQMSEWQMTTQRLRRRRGDVQLPGSAEPEPQPSKEPLHVTSVAWPKFEEKQPPREPSIYEGKIPKTVTMPLLAQESGPYVPGKPRVVQSGPYVPKEEPGYLKQFAAGAAKEIGDLLVGAGQLVQATPILGDITDLVNEALYGMSPQEAERLMLVAREELKAKTAAEKVGKVATGLALSAMTGDAVRRTGLALADRLWSLGMSTLPAAITGQVAASAVAGGTAAALQTGEPSAFPVGAAVSAVPGAIGAVARTRAAPALSRAADELRTGGPLQQWQTLLQRPISQITPADLIGIASDLVKLVRPTRSIPAAVRLAKRVAVYVNPETRARAVDLLSRTIASGQVDSVAQALSQFLGASAADTLQEENKPESKVLPSKPGLIDYLQEAVTPSNLMPSKLERGFVPEQPKPVPEVRQTDMTRYDPEEIERLNPPEQVWSKVTGIGRDVAEEERKYRLQQNPLVGDVSALVYGYRDPQEFAEHMGPADVAMLLPGVGAIENIVKMGAGKGGLFSRLFEAAMKVPSAAKPAKILEMLSKNTNPEELKWTGLTKWLREADQAKPISKQEVLQHVQENAVRLQVIPQRAVDQPLERRIVELHGEIRLREEALAAQGTPIETDPEMARMIDELAQLESRRPERVQYDLPDYKTPGGENYGEDIITVQRPARQGQRAVLTDYEQEHIRQIEQWVRGHPEEEPGGGWDLETLQERFVPLKHNEELAVEHWLNQRAQGLHVSMDEAAQDVLKTQISLQEADDVWRSVSQADRQAADYIMNTHMGPGELRQLATVPEEQIAEQWAISRGAARAIQARARSNPLIDAARTFRSGHMQTNRAIPDIIGWTRSQEREIPEHGRGLGIEEFQSDLHSAGGKWGYITDDQFAEQDWLPKLRKIQGKMSRVFEDSPEAVELDKELEALYKSLLPEGVRLEYRGGQWFPITDEWKIRPREVMPWNEGAGEFVAVWGPQNKEVMKGFDRVQDAITAARSKAVPDTIFKEDWPDLLMKQQLLRAAQDPSYNWFGFTEGMIQAKRYNLRQYIDELKWTYNPVTDLYKVSFKRKGNPNWQEVPNLVHSSDLGDYMGTAAGKVREETGKSMQQWKELEDKTDLKLGQAGFFKANPEAHAWLNTEPTREYHTVEGRLIPEHHGSLSGMQLEAGGEGWIHTYDETYRNKLQKIINELWQRTEAEAAEKAPQAAKRAQEKTVYVPKKEVQADLAKATERLTQELGIPDTDTNGLLVGHTLNTHGRLSKSALEDTAARLTRDQPDVDWHAASRQISASLDKLPETVKGAKSWHQVRSGEEVERAATEPVFRSSADMPAQSLAETLDLSSQQSHLLERTLEMHGEATPSLLREVAKDPAMDKAYYKIPGQEAPDWNKVADQVSERLETMSKETPKLGPRWRMVRDTDYGDTWERTELMEGFFGAILPDKYDDALRILLGGHFDEITPESLRAAGKQYAQGAAAEGGFAHFNIDPHSVYGVEELKEAIAEGETEDAIDAYFHLTMYGASPEEAQAVVRAYFPKQRLPLPQEVEEAAEKAAQALEKQWTPQGEFKPTKEFQEFLGEPGIGRRFGEVSHEPFERVERRALPEQKPEQLAEQQKRPTAPRVEKMPIRETAYVPSEDADTYKIMQRDWIRQNLTPEQAHEVVDLLDDIEDTGVHAVPDFLRVVAEAPPGTFVTTGPEQLAQKTQLELVRGAVEQLDPDTTLQLEFLLHNERGGTVRTGTWQEIRMEDLHSRGRQIRNENPPGLEEILADEAWQELDDDDIDFYLALSHDYGLTLPEAQVVTGAISNQLLAHGGQRGQPLTARALQHYLADYGDDLLAEETLQDTYNLLANPHARYVPPEHRLLPAPERGFDWDRAMHDAQGPVSIQGFWDDVDLRDLNEHIFRGVAPDQDINIDKAIGRVAQYPGMSPAQRGRMIQIMLKDVPDNTVVRFGENRANPEDIVDYLRDRDPAAWTETELMDWRDISFVKAQDAEAFWGVRMTPELRERIKKGLPLLAVPSAVQSQKEKK